MARTTQTTQVSSPTKADMIAGLPDFAAVIQRNFEEIFDSLSNTKTTTVFPTSSEGVIGDRILFDDGTTRKLFIRFPSGWFSSTFS